MSRMTAYQVPRSASPDTEMLNRMYLVKNVKALGLTYQIRLLTFHAVESGKKLVLKVPANCSFQAKLEEFVKSHRKHVQRENY
jgi:hypothetical protein